MFRYEGWDGKDPYSLSEPFVLGLALSALEIQQEILTLSLSSSILRIISFLEKACEWDRFELLLSPSFLSSARLPEKARV